MRVICERLFQTQQLTMKNILIPLCKNTSDRYHFFNILRIIAIVYHIYIECELYNLEYKKRGISLNRNSKIQQLLIGKIINHSQGNLFTKVIDYM